MMRHLIFEIGIVLNLAGNLKRIGNPIRKQGWLYITKSWISVQYVYEAGVDAPDRFQKICVLIFQTGPMYCKHISKGSFQFLLVHA